MKKQILHITSEVAPFYKRGGLGDVLGALPYYLNSSDYSNVVVSQYYEGCMSGLENAIEDEYSMQIHGIAYPYKCYFVTKSGVSYYFLNLVDTHLYTELETAGDGDQPYKGTSSFMYYIYFAKTVLDLIARLNLSPQHIFCHDWQTCGIFAFKEELSALRQQCATTTILMIHNYEFQGKILEDAIPYLPEQAKAEIIDTLSRFGQVTMLGLGIYKSDYVATVSNSYAQELMKGMAPHKWLCFLKGKTDVKPLFNGVDYDIWHPERSSYLPINYDFESFYIKKEYKNEVLKEYQLRPVADHENIPLVLFIARLTVQKGIQLLTAKENIEKLDSLLNQNIRMVIHGSPSGGSKGEIHKTLTMLQEKYPGILAYDPKYSDEKANRLLAGGDILLVPSLFEPCGLVQIYAMAFGTVPVVRATGGLRDSVNDYVVDKQDATGFHFHEFNFDSMKAAISRAVSVYQNSKYIWNELILNGMKMNFSWNRMTSEYYRFLAEIESGKEIVINKTDQKTIVNQS